MQGRTYTWSQGETLRALVERKDDVMQRHADALVNARAKRKNLPLIDVLTDALDDDDDTTPCVVCNT